MIPPTREDKLEAALRDVMEWIGNWDPEFIYDPDWPTTEDKIQEALQ